MQKGEIPDPRAGSTKFRAPPLSAAGVRVGYKGRIHTQDKCSPRKKSMASIKDLEKALSATAVSRQGRIYRKTLYGDFCRYES